MNSTCKGSMHRETKPEGQALRMERPAHQENHVMSQDPIQCIACCFLRSAMLCSSPGLPGKANTDPRMIQTITETDGPNGTDERSGGWSDGPNGTDGRSDRRSDGPNGTDGRAGGRNGNLKSDGRSDDISWTDGLSGSRAVVVGDTSQRPRQGGSRASVFLMCGSSIHSYGHPYHCLDGLLSA